MLDSRTRPAYAPRSLNPVVGATARPNEITFSEDWMRPDYIPPQPPPAAAAPPQSPTDTSSPLAAETPLPAEQAAPTNPNDGLAGLMVPPGGEG